MSDIVTIALRGEAIVRPETGTGRRLPSLDGLRALSIALVLLGHVAGTQEWYTRLLSSPAFVLVPLFLILTNALCAGRPRISYPVGQTFLNLAIAVCIDRCVRLPVGLVGRILNFGPVAFVGTLSYSIYVWQQPFLDRKPDSSAAAFPLNLGLLIVAALLSHFLVERPFLSLRKRFSH